MIKVMVISLISLLVSGNGISPPTGMKLLAGLKLRGHLVRSEKDQVLQLMRTYNLTPNTILNARQENLLHIWATVMAGRDDRDLFHQLIGEDTSFDEVNEDGMTAVHLAAINRNFWLMEFLLINGARATIKNNVGKSASDYLDRVIDHNMYELLEKYSGVEQLLAGGTPDKMQPRRSHGDLFGDLGSSSADKQGNISMFATKQPPEESTSSTDGTSVEPPAFLISLNDRARNGEIDTVVGRAEEIRQLAEVLGRRQKNNPIMIGDAGVGKTAIVEGLADLIVKGEVSEQLQDKTIYTLDLLQLKAGTAMQGEFESRVTQLLDFVENSPDALLFVDEAHVIAATESAAGVNLSDALKPALARGKLRLIAATTNEEYQQHILPDKALTRRLIKLDIVEPSLTSSAEILFSLQEKLVEHHQVEISDAAIWAAVTMSARYLQDKRLPDKAIDLIDEGSSALRLARELPPRDLQEMETEIRELEIYQQLELSDDQTDQQLTNLYDQHQKATEEWQKKDAERQELQRIDAEIAKRQQELREYEANDNFSEARRYRYQTIPALEAERASYDDDNTLTRTDVAAVVARRTGIPVEKILQDHHGLILELLPYLQGRVYGQDQQLQAIAERLVIAFAGLNDENRPLASFIMTGPSGSGKTETAKALAQFLFANDDDLIRVDMSEYREAHAVARLIGSPPGYVGYEEGGMLTAAVRRRPHSLILFDEIEKAHPEFADILLQVLSDGRLTDRHGTVDFSNTVVVMTSNSEDLRAHFRKELLGRIDKILVYNSLDKQVMFRLIDRQLEILNERLRQKQVTVELSSALREQLATQGFSEEFGARPLTTLFGELVSSHLARKIVGEGLPAGSYLIDIDGQTTKILPIEEN